MASKVRMKNPGSLNKVVRSLVEEIQADKVREVEKAMEAIADEVVAIMRQRAPIRRLEYRRKPGSRAGAGNVGSVRRRTKSGAPYRPGSRFVVFYTHTPLELARRKAEGVANDKKRRAIITRERKRIEALRAQESAKMNTDIGRFNAATRYEMTHEKRNALIATGRKTRGGGDVHEYGGYLRGSIEHGPPMVSKNTISVTFRATAPYAKYVEYGTRYMAARPFFFNTLAEYRLGKLNQRIRQGMARSGG